MTRKYPRYSKLMTFFAVASLAMIYGCDNDSSSSSENHTCSSNAPSCGDVCCPYECIDNVCVSPNGGDTTPNPQTEDECTKNGQTFCSGKCVSIQSDPMHCGDCTTICAGKESCQDGKCVLGCGEGLTLVGNGLCVAPDSDSEHCGADDVACGEAMYCDKGQCKCMDKRYDCDGKIDNGCESAVKCEYLCEEGKKTCGLNFCCAETESCCGTTCCAEGTTCCGGTTCIDLQSDPHHCGSCKEECKSNEKCEAGACVDNSKSCDTEGQMACWGTCIDVMSDAKNCGSCDHVCDEGISCIEGKCQIVCSDGLQLCDDECADFKTSPKHCGNCETQCANTQTCVEGTCTDNTEVSCESEEVNKDLCWGTCVDMQSDTSHCGKCGQTCSKAQICISGACVDQPKPGECSAGQKMCFGECKDILTDVENCGECLNKCGENHTCEAGKCEVVCNESQIKCDGACFDPKTSIKNCGACGNACTAGMECREVDGGTGACQCDAGHFDCDGDPANGCESTTECACKKGQKQACWRGDPANRNKGICKDGTQECDASGKFWGPCEGGVYPSAVTCNDAGIYIGGDQNCNDIPDEQEDCKSKCDLMVSDMSYIGCEYWPVYLHNASKNSFYVVMSNPQSTTAHVKIYTKSTYASMTPVEVTLAPNEVKKQQLDNTGPTSSSITQYAYRLRSDVPIVVYQFNPMPLVQIYTNDASLLLPVNTFGKEYLIMNWTGDTPPERHETFVSVVAVEPGETTVKYTTKVTTTAGSLGSMQAGTTKEFKLKQFEILNLEDNGESIGSRVSADKKVAVYSGGLCQNVPANYCCCDHLEEQLFPLQTWGKHYNAVKSKPRLNETEFWRIIAQKDNTKVELSAPLSQTFNLNAGEYKQLETKESFQITANNPILVGQFLVGTHYVKSGSSSYGDPSFILNVPYEQYRTDYSFLVPTSYKENYITIVTPKNNTIKLDGKNVDQTSFKSVGTDFMYGYVSLGTAEATHRIIADKPVGLWGYGFADYVSYGYPIGLDLKRINNTN